MIYRFKSSISRRLSKSFYILVFATILSILLGLSFSTTRSAVYFLARPIWYISNNISNSLSSVSEFFSFRNTLVSKVDSLESKVISLNLKLADYDQILKENQSLKTMLGRSDTTGKTLAIVLSSPPQSPYDTLVIDAGSADGLKVGNWVLSEGNTMIGFVSDITTHTSLVTLLSKAGDKHFLVLERTKTHYEMTGQGGGNMIMLVPKEADILWGDTFIYPDLSPLVVGSVYYIDSDPQNSFKTVYIKMASGIFSNTSVFVKTEQQ